MMRTRQKHLLRWLALPAALAAVLGTAAFIRGQPKREVTTRSEAAYRIYKEGVNSLRQVRNADAEQAFRKSVELDSTFAMAWVRLGRLNLTYRGVQAARPCYERALRRAPRVKPVERCFIQLLGMDLSGKSEDRKAYLAGSLERFPDNAELLLLYANQSFGAMDFEEALAAYRKLVQRDPSMGDMYNMIGYSLTELGRWPEALEAFQKYAFLCPQECNPHDSLGELYLRMGRYADAQKEFDRALAIKPDFSWGWLHKAMTCSDQGDFESAIRYVHRGLQAAGTGPDVTNLKNQLINMHLLAGHADSVVALCRARADAEPSDRAPRFFMARLHVAQGQPAAARRELDAFRDRLAASCAADSLEFEDVAQRNFQWNELQGLVALAEHRYEDAADHLKEAVGTADGWWICRRIQLERLEALVQLGRADEARGLADALLQVNPGLTGVRRLRARVEPTRG